MHKATLLEATIKLKIAPDGPILIKASDRGGGDPARPDMEFVRSRGEVFIPGSSLKGVLRAQCERICRSLDSNELQEQRRSTRSALDMAEAQERIPPDQRVPLADNPLGGERVYKGLETIEYSSGRYIESLRTNLADHPQRTALIYRRSSFTSQLFGHTSLAGRVRFADAYAANGETIITEERNGVAIDRIYGSVAVGPFNYEVAVAGSFETRIDLRNVSLAQLALLGMALHDLAEGRVGIGFGKSRGLGRVAITFSELTLSYPTCVLAEQNLKPINQASSISTGHIAGVGALAGAAYKAYNFPAPAVEQAALAGIDYSFAETPAQLPAEASGIFALADEPIGVRIAARGSDHIAAVWKACGPAWRKELGLG